MTTRAQVTASIRSARALGGIEVEPAPRAWSDALGLAVLGLLAVVLPEPLFIRFRRLVEPGAGGRA